MSIGYIRSEDPGNRDRKSLPFNLAINQKIYERIFLIPQNKHNFIYVLKTKANKQKHLKLHGKISMYIKYCEYFN